MNGTNQMVNMDDKIFNFVLNYAKVMGILEETEINLMEIGKSVITRKSGQKQVGIVELNDLWDIVDEYFDELDDDVRGFYKDKMEILELRIATLMKLTSIHGWLSWENQYYQTRIKSINDTIN